jgi:bacillithiol system protein YtxJ
VFWKSSTNIPELAPHQCDALWESDLAIIFKHSSACAISWAAHAEVSRFLTQQPGVPVYLVPVREKRQLSRAIEARSGVRHESPQVLVIHRGGVIADASHGEITAEFLAQAVAAAATGA